MALTDKDILITPNDGSSTADPKQEFTGASSSASDKITLETQFDGSITTLSFDGSEGQLFSISNDLTGTIFAVNDSAGIPSLEIDNDGEVRIAEFSGNVGIGLTAPVDKLHVKGTRIRLDGTQYELRTSAGVFRAALSDDGGKTTIFGDGNGSQPYITLNGSDVIIGDGTSGQAKALQLFVGSAAVTTDNTGLTFTMDGTYADGRFEHRFRKRDEGGGIPLYIDKTEGTAGSHTAIVRFGSYTNNADQFEVYGGMKASGNLTVTGTGNFSGDVNFEGGLVKYHASSNSLKFGDGIYAQFGASDDLRIYHNGTDSYIEEAGTGNLNIKGNGSFINFLDSSNNLMAYMVPGGAVGLYHNTSKKFETTSSGATVTGTLAVTGDLNVTGDINTVSVTDLDVSDKTITVGVGQSEANSGSSGLKVSGPSTQPSLLWNESLNQWEFNYGLKLPGTVNIASGASTADLVLGTYSTTNQGILYMTGSTANKQAVLKCTNGNLHVDSNSGNSIYLNFYSGNGIAFGSGAGSTVAWMGSDGDLWKGSSDNSGSKYWHAGNDGAGSGLDADTLDGTAGDRYIYGTDSLGAFDSSTFAVNPPRMGFFNINNSSAENPAGFGYWQGLHFRHNNQTSTWGWQLAGTYNSTYPDLYFRQIASASRGSWNKLWATNNDGSGSGLDADLLDGQHGSYYAPASGANYVPSGGTWMGANFNGSRHSGLSVNGGVVTFIRDHPNNAQMSVIADGAYYAGENNGFYSLYSGNSYNNAVGFYADTSGNLQWNAKGPYAQLTTPHGYIQLGPMNTSHAHIYTDRTNFYFNKTLLYAASTNNLIWHGGNDGSGSGLDADTVDGKHKDFLMHYKGQVSGNFDTIFSQTDGHMGVYQVANIANNSTNFPTGSYTYGGVLSWQLDDSTFKLYAPHTGTLWYQTGWNNDEYSGWRKIWDNGNDGSGSGLDADLLDGVHGASFLRSDAADTGASSAATYLNLGYLKNSKLLIADGSSSFTDAYNDSPWYGIGKTNVAGYNGTGYNKAQVAYYWGLTLRSAQARIELSPASNGPINFGDGGTSNWAKMTSTGIYQGTSNLVWHAGNDGSGSGLDADLLDGQHGSYYAPATGGNYTNLNHFRHTGTGNYTSTTTSALLTEVLGDDGFDSYLTAHKTSWSYAGNGNLTDAGRLTELAGSSWLWWTDNSADNVQGNITGLAIAPTTGGSAGKMFVYNNQGSGYAPGWREIWTSSSDGSGSGLDADLLDGAQGSDYVRSTQSTAITAGNVLSFKTSGGSERGFLKATDTNDEHFIIATSGGEDIAFKDGGVSGTTNMIIRGDGSMWLRGAIANGTIPYSQVTGTPTIPTNNNQLTNGAAYITASGTANQSHMVSGSAFGTTGSPGSVLEYQQAASITDTKLAPDGNWNNTIRMGHGNPYSYYSNTLAMQMTGTGTGRIRTQTISNNTALGWREVWDSGNDGSGSGLDADLLDGLDLHTARNNEVNKVVRTDSNGYIQAGWINTTSGSTTGTNRIYASNDGYIRYVTPATLISNLGLFTTSNDGSGSGLDADTLDGYNAEEGAVNNSIVKRDGTASVKAHGLSLMRQSTATTGISWYNESYYNWQDYMASAGATSCGPNGNLTAPTGLAGVTSWALRSRMEGVSTYGWIWETGSGGGGGATATAKMSLNATTGNLTIVGHLDIGSSKNYKINNVAIIGKSSTTLRIGDIDENDDWGTVDILAMAGTGRVYIADGEIFFNGTSNGSAGFKMIGTTGAFHANNDVIAYSSTLTASDERLKENIRPIESSLDKVLTLKGVKFDWKDKDRANDQLGFIAQDVEKVLPEVVNEIENGLGDYDGHKVVNYSAVVPVLVEAIKEQQKLINRLEDRLKDLEDKNGEN